MENLLLEAITCVKNVSKKKLTIRQLLAHINILGASPWDESFVEGALCILCIKTIINENDKVLATNDVNTLPGVYELLKTSLISSIDYNLPEPNLLLFQESQFFTSNSTTLINYSAVTSSTPTLHSERNSNLNKHDLNDKRIKH